VYHALARLAGHPQFYDKLKKENGIPVLIYELNIRRQNQKKQQNNRKASTASLSSKRSLDVDSLGEGAEEEEDSEGDFAEELVFRLKRDHACIKIQACCRTFLTHQRQVRLMELLGKFKLKNEREL
jgi:hypothetical protein